MQPRQGFLNSPFQPALIGFPQRQSIKLGGKSRHRVPLCHALTDPPQVRQKRPQIIGSGCSDELQLPDQPLNAFLLPASTFLRPPQKAPQQAGLYGGVIQARAW